MIKIRISTEKLLCYALILFVILLAGWLTGCSFPSRSFPDGGDFSVKLLSTGKSDCTIIYQDGLVIVNDTADSDDADYITSTLKKDGISRIDYLILSHYDKDHIGSAASLLERFDVRMVLRPDYTEESAEYTALTATEAERSLPVTILRENYRIDTKNGYIIVDPPDTDYGDDNNNSVITTVCYRDHKLLFLGDAKKKRIEEYLDATQDNCDFVKLPHHGSWNKSLGTLIDRTGLRWAAVTDSSRSDVSSKLIAQLKEMGITLLYTSDGMICISWDGNDLTVEQD